MQDTYTVKRGDTLYGISNQFGVSVTELAELNGIKGSNLQIGTILKIPSKSGTNPNNMFMYTIVPGDTLYKIASKYNTTVAEIKSLNYLTSDNLKVGTIIRIPENYTKEEEMYLPNYINYIVKPGDTLYKIASMNNISVSDLIKDNAITDNNIQIGQTLKIRVPKTMTETVEECYGEDYEPTDDITTNTYKIKAGDTIYGIAKKFNTTTGDIINLNNLKSTNLTIGQILNIPIKDKIYIVKSGDNLYAIAKKYGTTVDAIKRKNNLGSNNLSIGQKLLI